jgi:hypothetical protein
MLRNIVKNILPEIRPNKEYLIVSLEKIVDTKMAALGYAHAQYLCLWESAGQDGRNLNLCLFLALTECDRY